MLAREEFIRNSLEINLFFQRIMKEHLFLIETNLQPPEADNIAEASRLKRNFEQLLAESVDYTKRVRISERTIRSNEFVTPYTLRAEEITSMLTGASIDTRITEAELELFNPNHNYSEQLENDIRDLNSRTLDLLEEVISFQRSLMALRSRCEIFITLYDEMLEHDTREAEYYQDILRALQNRRMPRRRTFCGELNFWNNIMGEHAQFIDGLLDPTEERLKETAETFAERFGMLVERCISTAEREILQRSIATTGRIRNFKQTATEGLLDCEIRSIIPPLLADHVLREANHYLRILRRR